MSRRALYAVAAAATVALLIALTVDLLQASHHRTGANGRIRSTDVNVPSGSRLCQPAQTIEPGTGRVRFYAHGVAPTTGPFEVSVEWGGGVVARGSVPAQDVGLEGRLVAPVGPIPARLRNATVCIVNRGGPAQILGQPISTPIGAAQLPVTTQPAAFIVVTLDYQYAHRKSWFSFAPTVAHRFGLVKVTFFGSWTFWVAMLALLALALTTIWWTARMVAR